MTSRLIVTDDATYEQRPAGTSNAGGALTEVREVHFTDDGAAKFLSGVTQYTLLDPSQAEPRVGDRWALRHAHGRYTLTATVNEIIGDLA